MSDTGFGVFIFQLYLTVSVFDFSTVMGNHGLLHSNHISVMVAKKEITFSNYFC